MKQLKIENKIRLIELFAGVGSQAAALRNIGADFEKYLICEWWTNAFASYKEIHFPENKIDYSESRTKEELTQALFDYGISADGKKPMSLDQIKRKPETWKRETYNNIKATNNIVDITKAHGTDLRIVETDQYTYILTYSFPCQDLSRAGKMAGMDRGSGTRSGMLWEVERLLNEVEELPQVLLMENVPQFVGKRNEKNFNEWKQFLESKGYRNFTEILNAKYYGMPQNRNRAFMVSILGDYGYIFPRKTELKKTVDDFYETEVDKEFYIPNEKAKDFIEEYTEKGREKKICNAIRGGGRRSLDRHQWDAVVEFEESEGGEE